MAIVKSEYNVLNPTSGQYDTHYLKTSVDQVSGLRGELDTMSGDITTLSSGKVNKAGDTITGVLKFQGKKSHIVKDTNASYLELAGGTDCNNGSYIAIYGKDNTTNTNIINIVSRSLDNNTKYYLTLGNNGKLTWDGNSVDTVVASGNNYIRYASGLQICWGTFSTGAMNYTIAWGTWYYNSTAISFDFPVAFSGIPIVNIEKCSTNGSSGLLLEKDVSNTGVGSIKLARATIATNVSAYMSYIAIGRWK